MDKESFFNKNTDSERIRQKHEDFFNLKSSKHQDIDEQSKKHEAFFSGDKDFFEKHNKQTAASYDANPDFFKNVLKQAEKEDDKSGDPDPTFFMGINRDYVIQEVQQDGLKLEKFQGYCNDMQVVSLAVENNSNAFQFASKKLKINKEFVDILISAKQLDLEEAKAHKSSDSTKIAILEYQIQIIIDIHNQAVESESNKQGPSYYNGMSM